MKTRRIALPTPRFKTLLATILLATICLLPTVLLAVLSLGSGWTFPHLLPDRLHAGTWLQWLAPSAGLPAALLQSMTLSAVVSVWSTVAGLLIGRAVHRSERQLWRFLLYLPFVISPVIVSVALYDLFVRVHLAGKATGVILVQSLFATAFAAIFFQESATGRGERYEQLVQTLGGGWLAVARHAIWSTSRGLIGVCLLQTAIYSWVDYAIVSLVGGGQVPTITMRLFAYLREANVNQAAAVALILMLPAIAAAWIGLIFSPARSAVHSSLEIPSPTASPLPSPPARLITSMDETNESNESNNTNESNENPMMAAPHSAGSLELRDIQVRLSGQLILPSVSLVLPPSETLVILGESGCGKTTLLRAIAGLVEPTEGTILLAGIDITEQPIAERGIVYLDQEPLLFPHLNVAENLAFGPRLRGESPDQIARAVDEMLRALELTDHRAKRDGQLSGGQKQRVAFGRALLARPRLLLLDEPFGSLDGTTRATMQSLFVRLAVEYQLTTVFVTHDVKESLLVGHRFARLDRGQLQTYASRAAFMSDPATGIPAEQAFWSRLIDHE